MKVVINECYGGFGLSEKAMLRYGELKGIKIYPKPDKYGLSKIYYTVPVESRVEDKYSEQTIYDGDINRDDKNLIKVVEELGEEANGFAAELKIVEIPDDVNFEIEEYDGNEWIAEAHRTWS